MLFFASFTTRFLRYVLRTVLAYVQNAPGILVRYSRTKVFDFLRKNNCLVFTDFAFRAMHQRFDIALMPPQYEHTH